MTPFASSKDILIADFETSEKIDEKYLKSFVLSNLKLKNIVLNSNDTIYINFIENINEYQIFIVNNSFVFFEFEVFSLYKYKKNSEFELFICEDFFVIFKNLHFYYYQKISENINQDDFLQFLNKKFKIQINIIHQINKEMLQTLKNEFLKIAPKKHSKEPLKKLELKINLSFYIYIFYLLIVIFCVFYYYENSIKTEEKEQTIVDIEEIKSKFVFSSFQESFYEILENIVQNNLELISFKFIQNRAKIVVNHKNKDSINLFLESCKNVISSSINFLEDSKSFEATIDVEFSKK